MYTKMLQLHSHKNLEEYFVSSKKFANVTSISLVGKAHRMNIYFLVGQICKYNLMW